MHVAIQARTALAMTDWEDLKINCKLEWPKQSLQHILIVNLGYDRHTKHTQNCTRTANLAFPRMGPLKLASYFNGTPVTGEK